MKKKTKPKLKLVDTEKRIGLRLPEVTWHKLNQKCAALSVLRVNGSPNVSAYIRQLIDADLGDRK